MIRYEVDITNSLGDRLSYVVYYRKEIDVEKALRAEGAIVHSVKVSKI